MPPAPPEPLIGHMAKMSTHSQNPFVQHGCMNMKTQPGAHGESSTHGIIMPLAALLATALTALELATALDATALDDDPVPVADVDEVVDAPPEPSPPAPFEDELDVVGEPDPDELPPSPVLRLVSPLLLLGSSSTSSSPVAQLQAKMPMTTGASTSADSDCEADMPRGYPSWRYRVSGLSRRQMTKSMK
jgi:hypothetical protein